MQTFVDSSALIALLDQEDDEHAAVVQAWERLRTESSALLTTSYMIPEAAAVCQRRLGMEAARLLLTEILPLVSIVWVDAATHKDGEQMLLTANRRDLSLVDCISFDVMRRLGIRAAFALDDRFREQGFDCLP